MTAAWGAAPPEINSAGFWCGPGASSFEAAAAELTALVAGIMALLGGDEAVAAALAFAWPAPTGDTAILANVPHLLWQGSSAGMLAEAAAQIQATAAAFESLKAATPTPTEVESNQAEHVALNAANFLGMLTPLIIANRTQYFGDYWVRSASNKYSYAAASATGVQAIPPLPPPVQTAMPMGGDQQSASDPMQQAMQMPMQMAQMPMQMLGQLGGQFGQVAGMGQQFMSPLMSSMSSMSGSSGVGAPAGALDSAAGGWAGAAPLAGGPVSASLAAGGGGIGGVSGASSALRGPVSWASATVPGSAESPAARLVGAETSVSTAPAGVGGGAMMGPMAARAAAESNERGDEAKSTALLSAAILYRAPASVPVVTGGSGAMFGGREVLN